jgi:hypothetical protein
LVVQVATAPQLSVTKSTSVVSASFVRGETVGVRPNKNSEDSFWIGKVVQVHRTKLTLQWYNKDQQGRYVLGSEEEVNTVPNGSIIARNIMFTPTNKLFAATISEIKGAL